MSTTRRTLLASGATLAASPFGPAEAAQAGASQSSRAPESPGAHRSYAFEQWDVFTSQPLTGNPLAVFPDARGLDDAQMLAIAREMNLSETTFVIPRDPALEREQGIRVRIFRPMVELPFAGHPVLGSAWALRAARGANRLDLHLNAGKVPVQFETVQGHTTGTMTQPDPEFREHHEAAAIAPLFGLRAEDFDASLPIQNVSIGGRSKVVVPLKSLDPIRRLQLDFGAVRKYFATGDPLRAFFFITRETIDPAARFHARYPIPDGEDPVTGSGGGCVIAWAVNHGIVKSDEQIVIEQGHEMKRPGAMSAAARKSGATVSNVRIGGSCAKVMEGRLTV